MDNTTPLYSIDTAFKKNKKTKPLNELKLESIDVVKIYNCFHGKKIWSLKEPQVYQDECMHSSFDSAAEFAETQRARGRTLYIKELPAFLLKAGDYSIVITQLNESHPLKEYSITAVAVEENADESSYLMLGAAMDKLVSSFSHNSRFWKKNPSKDNSTVILYADNKTAFQPLKTTKLKAWESKSAGKGQCLDWYVEDSNVKQSALLKHFKQASSLKTQVENSKEPPKPVKQPPSKPSGKTKKSSLDTLFRAIRGQRSNGLFFFYRENDIEGCFGGSCEFWVERNSGRFDIASDYLLYAKSEKKGIEVFQVEPETCEVALIPDVSK